ncbi:hypothetical protein EKO07_03920 [Enterobacter hormaechei subsp. xiangfangensis]|uniref:hypothetical protein n=1 Tax=Enterobacter hormaechei TaxID=158836 RepID=UPI000F81F285|nr:hypothetical protein [Enterobacter hormaechei]RTM39749.1 hypothetical protein EKO13_07625 [Enterobacter hormaechei subsp. xiangfangensis]RTM73963.1 hypothetical protein EKO07_03920 [Enterobacter hormaechei subsp. xiangfangensis]VAE11073.1 Uncharacterised protein [Enterobacter hormaechei]VAF48701.1 Uncharacterised protein [Enterobacter hormaechei]
MTKYIALLAIALAWLVYFCNFSPFNGFSTDKTEWGAFGDFIGGVTNPILTFITIVMLIRSLNFQSAANKSLLKQNEQIFADSIRQKEIEDLRSFESTFYNLAEISRREFEMLSITDEKGLTYTSGHAVKFIEQRLIELCKTEHEFKLKKYFAKIDDDSSMAIYSAVRSFYILFKLTDEACPEKFKERYYDICNYTMPIKFINLVSLAYVFTDWKILKSFDKYDFFKRKGVFEYVESFTRVKENF